MKLSQQIQIKSLDAVTGVFSGYAWRYGDEPDRSGERIIKGAFNATIERLKSAGNSLPLLWVHDKTMPIGSLYEFEDTDEGLLVTGKLELSIEKAREAYELLKQKILSLSIGFMFADDAVSFDAGGVKTFSAVDLFEVSLTPTPVNAQSTITSIKSLADCQGSIRDFENGLRDAGLSKKAARTVAAVGYSALKVGCDAQDQGDAEKQQILKALNSATQTIKSI